MTPEREKEIRALLIEFRHNSSAIDETHILELLEEIDRLRMLASASVTEKELALTEEIDRLRAEEEKAVRDIKAAGQAWNEHLEKYNQLQENLAVAMGALEFYTLNERCPEEAIEALSKIRGEK